MTLSSIQRRLGLTEAPPPEEEPPVTVRLSTTDLCRYCAAQLPASRPVWVNHCDSWRCALAQREREHPLEDRRGEYRSWTAADIEAQRQAPDTKEDVVAAPRAFDHDEARRLAHTEDLSNVELARRFGVTETSIRRVVGPRVAIDGTTPPASADENAAAAEAQTVVERDEIELADDELADRLAAIDADVAGRDAGEGGPPTPGAVAPSRGRDVEHGSVVERPIADAAQDSGTGAMPAGGDAQEPPALDTSGLAVSTDAPDYIYGHVVTLDVVREPHPRQRYLDLLLATIEGWEWTGPGADDGFDRLLDRAERQLDLIVYDQRPAAA